jgi:hypothetical protein
MLVDAIQPIHEFHHVVNSESLLVRGWKGAISRLQHRQSSPLNNRLWHRSGLVYAWMPWRPEEKRGTLASQSLWCNRPHVLRDHLHIPLHHAKPAVGVQGWYNISCITQGWKLWPGCNSLGTLSGSSQSLMPPPPSLIPGWGQCTPLATWWDSPQQSTCISFPCHSEGRILPHLQPSSWMVPSWYTGMSGSGPCSGTATDHTGATLLAHISPLLVASSTSTWFHLGSDDQVSSQWASTSPTFLQGRTNWDVLDCPPADSQWCSSTQSLTARDYHWAH